MLIRNIGFATLVAFGSGGTIAAETLRFGSFEGPTGFITGEILTPWAQEVTEASNGALTIQMFPGGTLGRDPAQQLQLVENGVIDIAWIIPGYTPGRFQEGTVVELPFLVDDSASGSYATWQMYEQGLFAGDYNQLKMLGIFASPTNFIAAMQPIVEPSDMRGVNFRAPGPTLLSAVQLLGAVPIGGITGPGLAEALSRGLISGTSTQWGAVATFRVADVLTHYNTVPMGATPMLVVMNRARYESLSEEAKAVLDEYSGAAFSERFGRAFDEDNARLRGEIEASGIATIIDPDEALLARWRESLDVSVDNWIAENGGGQQLIEAFQAALDEYRATN